MHRLIVLFFALAGFLFPLAAHAQTALPSYGIPAGPAALALFPAGSKQTVYQSSVDNVTLDCVFYFICSGGVPMDPNFHVTDADSLGRIDGWAQVVVNHQKVERQGKRKTQKETYVLVPSSFGQGSATVPDITDPLNNPFVTLPNNQAAAQDFAATAIAGSTLKDDTAAPALIPDGVDGGQYVYAGRSYGTYYAAVSVYEGQDTEFEIVGVCEHCNKAAATQVHDTALAVAASLAQVS